MSERNKTLLNGIREAIAGAEGRLSGELKKVGDVARGTKEVLDEFEWMPVSSKEVILPEQVVSGFYHTYPSDFGDTKGSALTIENDKIGFLKLSNHTKLTVLWDDEEYHCTAYAWTISSEGYVVECVAAGNIAEFNDIPEWAEEYGDWPGSEGNPPEEEADLPFGFWAFRYMDASSGQVLGRVSDISAVFDANSVQHKIGISITGTTKKMPQKFLPTVPARQLDLDWKPEISLTDGKVIFPTQRFGFKEEEYNGKTYQVAGSADSVPVDGLVDGMRYNVIIEGEAYPVTAQVRTLHTSDLLSEGEEDPDPGKANETKWWVLGYNADLLEVAYKSIYGETATEEEINAFLNFWDKPESGEETPVVYFGYQCNFWGTSMFGKPALPLTWSAGSGFAIDSARISLSSSMTLIRIQELGYKPMDVGYLPEEFRDLPAKVSEIPLNPIFRGSLNMNPYFDLDDATGSPMGAYSATIGEQNRAPGMMAIAIGHWNTAKGDDDVCIGYQNSTNADSKATRVIIGETNHVSTTTGDIVALGKRLNISDDDAESTVVIGEGDYFNNQNNSRYAVSFVTPGGVAMSISNDAERTVWFYSHPKVGSQTVMANGDKELVIASSVSGSSVTHSIMADDDGVIVPGLDARVLAAAYPVGSVYMSVNETDPGELFGGSWEKIEDSGLSGVFAWKRTA